MTHKETVNGETRGEKRDAREESEGGGGEEGE